MFKQILSSSLVLVTLVFGMLSIVNVSATLRVEQPTGTGLQAPNVNDTITGGNTNLTNSQGVVDIIQRIINWATAVIAAIAVAFIVYGAFVWITQGQENGQKIVIQATVGLIVLVVSYFIAQIAVGLANAAQTTINQQ